MAGKELLKLVVLVLLVGVMFAAGFTMGMGLERRAWKFEAVKKRAGRWVRDPDTQRWVFEWRELPALPRRPRPPTEESPAAEAKPANNG